MKIFQKGFNFSQDGPENRLVYHLQGCIMKCIRCSNSEGMNILGGKDKWKSKYKMKDGFVSEKIVDEYNKVFKEYNLKIINT